MSYEVYLYAKSAKELSLTASDFGENMPKIPLEAIEAFKNKIVSFDYHPVFEGDSKSEYQHNQQSGSRVSIYETEICFSVSLGEQSEDAILDALTTATEIASVLPLVAYSPAEHNWIDTEEDATDQTPQLDSSDLQAHFASMPKEEYAALKEAAAKLGASEEDFLKLATNFANNLNKK